MPSPSLRRGANEVPRRCCGASSARRDVRRRFRMLHAGGALARTAHRRVLRSKTRTYGFIVARVRRLRVFAPPAAAPGLVSVAAAGCAEPPGWNRSRGCPSPACGGRPWSPLLRHQFPQLRSSGPPATGNDRCAPTSCNRLSQSTAAGRGGWVAGGGERDALPRRVGRRPRR